MGEEIDRRGSQAEAEQDEADKAIPPSGRWRRQRLREGDGDEFVAIHGHTVRNETI